MRTKPEDHLILQLPYVSGISFLTKTSQGLCEGFYNKNKYKIINLVFEFIYIHSTATKLFQLHTACLNQNYVKWREI